MRMCSFHAILLKVILPAIVVGLPCLVAQHCIPLHDTVSSSTDAKQMPAKHEMQHKLGNKSLRLWSKLEYTELHNFLTAC